MNTHSFWLRCTLATMALMFSCLAMAQAEQPPAKQSLVLSVQRWVALQEGIDASAVTVQANDKRFVVPACSREFAVEYAFGSRTNVRVACDSADWEAVLRIQIAERVELLTYARALPEGTQLGADDLLVIERDSRRAGRSTLSQDEVVGRLLRVGVSAGQEVTTTQFDSAVVVLRARQTLAVGSELNQALFDAVTMPLSSTRFDQRFDSQILEGAVATAKIGRGEILAKTDFAQTRSAIVIQSLVERGERIDSRNARPQRVESQVANNAVVRLDQLKRAVSKRRLVPGTVLRFSDFSLEPHVVENTLVTLSLQRSQFTLQLDVLALEDGTLGDSVRVRNQESGEILSAVVVGEGKVEISNAR